MSTTKHRLKTDQNSLIMSQESDNQVLENKNRDKLNHCYALLLGSTKFELQNEIVNNQ